MQKSCVKACEAKVARTFPESTFYGFSLYYDAQRLFSSKEWFNFEVKSQELSHFTKKPFKIIQIKISDVVACVLIRKSENQMLQLRY